MVESAPSSVDLQEFQFKLHSKCKIFDNSDDSKFKNSYSLIAAASRYGLIFFGSADASLEVIQLNALQNIELTNVKTESNCAKRSVPLLSKPTHLAINCDSTLLAVVCNKNDCATAIIYNVASFLSQNVSIVREIRLSATPGVNVLETTWNPAIPSILTACKNDGSLGVYNIQETSVDINELPVAAGATCFCWSPKGKQLVVGSANGSLTQYKPDLKAVKAIPSPPLNGKGPFCVVNVFWLTNYQFLAIYKDVGDEDARPMILIVNAPKTGNITYINYEDICYSYGNLRQPQYYIIHQPIWGVILVASANSMEVGVLGISQPGEPALWQQWNQIDAARAELPLSANHQETFPVGVSFDTGVTMQLPWGENQTLPPMPMIHILSHYGVLCSFSVINLKQGAANLCSPPEAVPDQSGLNQFIVKQMSPPSIASNTAMQKPGVPAPQPILPSSSVPGTPIASEQQKTTVQCSLFGVQKPPGTPESTAGAAGLPPSFGGSSQFSFGSSSMSTFQNVNPPTTISNKDTPLFSGAIQNPANTPSQGSISTPVNLSMGGDNANNSSMFGALATPNFNTSASKTTMFGISTPTATTPSLGSFTSKTATPTNSLSFSNTSLNTPSQQTNLTFSSKPTSQPLLATPKELIQPNLIQKPTPILKSESTENKSESNSQLSGSQTGSDTVIKDDSIIKDQMIQALIREEVKNFHAELQELFFRCKNINLNVGSEEEKTNLILKTDSLLEFYKELKDTTDSQVSEVYYLKQALMQSFAWYEDTRARHKRYTDPNFASLLQAQELDPVSEKQMADIKHLVYYIEAQLKQIDGFLDNQWADFQDACKRHIKGRLHIPTLEPIYQSLVRQNAILDRQKYILKDIGARIKSRHKKAANFPHVMNKLNTSAKNVENIQLYEELNNLKIEGDIFQSRYEKIVANEKKFTDTKKTKLYDFFSNRNVSHIAPRKPKFVSNIFQMSPSKFNATYTASPGVNRSLRSTFDSIAQQSNFDTTLDTSVEANMSSSNLFSFTLLESTRFKTPEKPKTKADLLFNTPKTSNDTSKTVLNPFPKIQESSNPLAYCSPTPQSIFNFTATSTAGTQGIQQNSTCAMSNTFTPSSNFTFDQTKFASVMPDTAKSSSNTTFFSFSSPNASTVDNRANEMNKAPEAKSAPKVPEASTFLGGLSTGDNNINQSFNFIAPQVKPLATAPKTNLVKNIFKGAGDVSYAARDSLDVGFSFGHLDLGQQSTPKPKVTVATSSSMFAQVSSSSQSTGKTTSPMPDSSSKPAFTFAQSATTVSQAFADSTPFLAGVTITPVASISAASTVPTTVASPFREVSTAPVTTMPSIFGLSQSTSSIFSSSSSTEVVKSSPLLQAKSTAPESINTTVISTTSIASVTQAASTASVVSTAPTITVILPASPSTFSFTQLSNAVSSTAPAKTTSLFGGTGAVTTAASSFSFIKPAASTPSTFGGGEAAKIGTIFESQATATETAQSTTLFAAPAVPAEPTKPVSIFGTPVATSEISKSDSIFGAPAAIAEITKSGSIFATTDTSKTTSIFGTQAAAVGTPKPTSIFGNAATTATSSSTAFAPPATTTQTQSGFGFGTQTTSSESTFSFGQLTVSALSPNASTSAAAAPATTSTSTFSFAIPAATTTTTATSTLGSTNVFSGFGKPATTTTASSFMGQSICSPNAFSQNQQTQQSNTGSIFGQAAANIFAQKPSSTASGTSIFGQSGGSIFGQSTGNTTASTTASSIFGQTQSSPFGSSAQSITSGGSIFGQSAGFTSPTATTTNSSIFGQSSFGTPATTSASGSFSFTQSASGSSGFAGSSSGGSIFGSKPTFGATPAFGQPPAFGSPPSFGATPASPSVFGSPAPANNSGTFGSGFGSPSAFGQKPAFGSPPSFGQASFGSSPAFGNSSSTFASPNRVFGGGAAPAAGQFGTTAQENSTFANLANQSTLGFGSLAQNQAPAAPQQQAPQFSGGAQFSSWR